MANDPESPPQTPAPSPRVLLAMGVGYTLGGAALLLLALGVIPASDRMFPVGRLVVGLVAACIVLAGVVVLARAAPQQQAAVLVGGVRQPRHRAHPAIELHGALEVLLGPIGLAQGRGEHAQVAVG